MGKTLLNLGEQSQARLIQTSSVALRDKTVTEEMKEGAQNLAQKAKEKVEDLANATINAAHDVKVGMHKAIRYLTHTFYFRKKLWEVTWVKK